MPNGTLLIILHPKKRNIVRSEYYIHVLVKSHCQNQGNPQIKFLCASVGNVLFARHKRSTTKTYIEQPLLLALGMGPSASMHFLPTSFFFFHCLEIYDPIGGGCCCLPLAFNWGPSVRFLCVLQCVSLSFSDYYKSRILLLYKKKKWAPGVFFAIEPLVFV